MNEISWHCARYKIIHLLTYLDRRTLRVDFQHVSLVTNTICTSCCCCGHVQIRQSATYRQCRRPGQVSFITNCGAFELRRFPLAQRLLTIKLIADKHRRVYVYSDDAYRSRYRVGVCSSRPLLSKRSASCHLSRYLHDNDALSRFCSTDNGSSILTGRQRPESTYLLLIGKTIIE